MDWIQLGQGPLPACCEHGDEVDPVANWKFGGQLENVSVLKNNSVMWSTVILIPHGLKNSVFYISIYKG
jgi:hypothetical protein